jgi:hypothetical protein
MKKLTVLFLFLVILLFCKIANAECGCQRDTTFLHIILKDTTDLPDLLQKLTPFMGVRTAILIKIENVSVPVIGKSELVYSLISGVGVTLKYYAYGTIDLTDEIHQMLRCYGKDQSRYNDAFESIRSRLCIKKPTPNWYMFGSGIFATIAMMLLVKLVLSLRKKRNQKKQNN